MKVCYLVANNGDGSSSVHFFQNQQDAETLANSEDAANLETYGCNDGEVHSFDINADGTTTIAWTEAKVPA